MRIWSWYIIVIWTSFNRYSIELNSTQLADLYNQSSFTAKVNF